MAGSRRELPLLFSNCTDVGKIREKNEDYLGYFRQGRRHLFVVADGMGGEAGGHQASRTAVGEVEAFFDDNSAMDPVELLRNCVRVANEGCVAIQDVHPEFKGMGTTLELLLVEGDLAWWAHVGDSRIYLIREGQARQLTVDHSRVQQMLEAGLITEEEAAEHPQRHVLSRVVGHSLDLEPDVTDAPFEMQIGDAFLLCSDGLCDLVSDDEMAWVVDRLGPQRACRRLVDIALERGGHDNTTVQVLFKGKAKRSWSKTKTAVTMPSRDGEARKSPKKTMIGLAGIAVIGVLAAMFWLRPGPPGDPGEVSPPASVRLDAERMARIRQAGGAIALDDGELELAKLSGRLRLPAEPMVNQRPDREADVTDNPVLLYSVEDLRQLARREEAASLLELEWAAPARDQELLLVIPFRLERELEGVALKTLASVVARYRVEEGREETREWIVTFDGNTLGIELQIEGKQSRAQDGGDLGRLEPGDIHVLFVRLAADRSWIALDGHENLRQLEDYSISGGSLDGISMRWVSELVAEGENDEAFAAQPALSLHDILLYDSFSTNDERLGDDMRKVRNWFDALVERKEYEASLIAKQEAATPAARTPVVDTETPSAGSVPSPAAQQTPPAGV